jgi:class 3 adenylate cyclase
MTRAGFYAVFVEKFTFLFTDIEGSTALLGRVGQDVYERLLADHHAIIRSGLAAQGGREVDTQGDAFFAVFSSPAACVMSRWLRCRGQGRVDGQRRSTVLRKRA